MTFFVFDAEKLSSDLVFYFFLLCKIFIIMIVASPFSSANDDNLEIKTKREESTVHFGKAATAAAEVALITADITMSSIV